MTRSEEIAIETRVLREVMNMASRAESCTHYAGDIGEDLGDRIEARLRDLTFEKRALDRLHKDCPGAEKQRKVG